jgi:hypothetical protein
MTRTASRDDGVIRQRHKLSLKLLLLHSGNPINKPHAPRRVFAGTHAFQVTLCLATLFRLRLQISPISKLKFSSVPPVNAIWQTS